MKQAILLSIDAEAHCVYEWACLAIMNIPAIMYLVPAGMNFLRKSGFRRQNERYPPIRSKGISKRPDGIFDDKVCKRASARAACLYLKQNGRNPEQQLQCMRLCFLGKAIRMQQCPFIYCDFRSRIHPALYCVLKDRGV